MTNSVELVAQLDVQNRLGEGVIWDAENACFWWSDILSSKLYRWHLEGQPEIFNTPEALCSFGLTAQSNVFICAFASGFALFDPIKNDLQWLCKVDQDKPNNRMNDGRVDRAGRFWAGSMRQSGHGPLGGLFCLRDGEAVKHIDEIKISNSLCWSKEGTTIYFADSPAQCIKQGAFDLATGIITDIRTFTKTNTNAYPDGSCVDNENCLWNAQWGSSKVKRYNSAGEEIFSIDLPCEQPSCVSFGGPNMQHLFVTSAWDGLSPDDKGMYQANGNCFVFKTPFTGIKEQVCTSF